MKTKGSVKAAKPPIDSEKPTESDESVKNSSTEEDKPLNGTKKPTHEGDETEDKPENTEKQAVNSEAPALEAEKPVVENIALDIKEEEGDSDSSQHSTNSTPDPNPTSKKKTVTDKIKRKKKKGPNGKSNGSANGMSRAKLHYKCSNFIKEDHKQPIFGVQFYQYVQDPDEDPLMFGTVGANRASIYRCGEGCGRINLYQSYADADLEESFYSCTWTYNPDTGDPLFCFAGAKGVIHILNPVSRQFVRSFQGYGSSINEVKTHPVDPVLIVGTSKDHTIRLWNIKTETCVAIFSGVEGHRDEVLSADFDILGTRIVSCGMDHSLKFWSLDTPKIKKAIADSHEYSHDKTRTTFQTLPVNYPEFTTRDVHRNYVDCCTWLGDLVLSKSCDNQVVCWRPKEPLDVVMNRKNNDEVGVFVLHKFEITQCDIWFMRFAVDYNQNLLAMGNQVGKIFLYSLEGNHPSMIKPQVLVNSRCNSAIRQMSFNINAKVLIAVCDDGTIWRWDKQ